jgi:CRAL/TRIO domain
LRELARTKLGETDTVRENAITAIRDWIMENPRIVKCRMDANFILRFLRFRKFNIAETKEAFERFLIFREGVYGEDWLSNLDVMKPNFYDLIDNRCCYIFPRRDELGRMIILHRYAAIDPNVPGIAFDFLSAVFMVLEILHESEENQIRGFQYILDFTNVGINFYGVMPFAKGFKYGKNFEKILTSRHQGFHVVNVNPAVTFFVKMVLRHTPQKIKERVHFYSSYEDLKIVSKHELPLECGGNADLSEFNGKK